MAWTDWRAPGEITKRPVHQCGEIEKGGDGTLSYTSEKFRLTRLLSLSCDDHGQLGMGTCARDVVALANFECGPSMRERL